jgi:hypothetical protein
MEYPQEFTPVSCARVEEARIKAGRDLALAQQEEPPADWATGKHGWDRCAFYAYVLGAFQVFAREACELGKKGTWSIERVREEADEFLCSFGFDAYRERGRDRFGQAFRGVIVNWDGGIEPAVREVFKKS